MVDSDEWRSASKDGTIAAESGLSGGVAGKDKGRKR
jgi:hypothetical protein